MAKRSVRQRIDILRTRADPPIAPPFCAFARAVIQFSGHEPTLEAVARLGRWNADRHRSVAVCSDSQR
jgi:hypothetical protein